MPGSVANPEVSYEDWSRTYRYIATPMHYVNTAYAGPL